MPRGEARARSDRRWILGGLAILFVAASLAAAWTLVIARRPSHDAPAGFSEPIWGLLGSHRLEEAETLARAALATARSDAPGSMRAADAMDDVVRVATARGRRDEVDEALSLAAESVRIREKSCGGDCPELATSLLVEEALLWHVGDYRAALPLAERAASIRRRVLDPRHPLVAQSLYLLAEAHRALGEYAMAARLHRQAIEIWQDAPARHAQEISDALHYLGVIHWTTGDIPGSREYFERSLALLEQSDLGATDAAASNIYALGNVAAAMGERDRALSCLDRALTVWAAALGPDDPHLARALASKAGLLAATGDLAAARPLLQRALAIREQAFGGDHYLVARSLADLGRLESIAGDRDEAQRRFDRALGILRVDPRSAAPDLAATLVADADLALAGGDRARAVDLALQAETIARGHFLQTSRDLDEQEALRYERVRGSGLDTALAAIVPAPSDRGGAPAPAGAAARVWDEVIRSRAMVLDAMAARRHPGEAGDAGRPGLAEVAQRLPAGSALVAFARYAAQGPPPAGAVSRYLALVLQPAEDPGAAAAPARPAVVPLGDAAAIEEAVRLWRAEAGADPRLEPRPPRETGAMRRYLETAQRLRRAIWDPVASQVAGRRLVLVAPDGAIDLVNFAALAGDDGRYLIESGPAIHYVSAERDIAAPHPHPGPGRGLLAVGGVDYDAALPPPGGAGGAPLPDGEDEQTPRNDTPTCRAFREMRFTPLSGSFREIEDIAALWSRAGGVTTLSGAQAAEDAFKRAAPGRRIIHLATHGYSLFDRCPSALTGLPQPEGPEGNLAVGEDPLLLSGLALSGANRRSGEPDEREDGILSAAEIGAMDLGGVEWAVLSGCETGLGQVLDGEGVLGLRRAFEVAGAGTLIMSLWPVDDGAARVWMRHLYEGRLSGLSTVESVNRAGLQMIAEQRAAGASTHPYFWGAFVATGDWR